MIGRTLSHFRILEKIGEGGMGVVYRAEDERLRRTVAIKVLPVDLVANPERRLRFLREARAAAAVTHPNIATIFEIDEADGIVFIAMELVEGRTLAAQIGGRPLQVREAVRHAMEIAEGLARAHQAHVVHRDLKPENIIVGADGHVKILDFGLAKLLDTHPAAGDAELSRIGTISAEMTQAGRIFGTAAYMSPEQARGRPVDSRSDLFSFGTTLYEMTTGRPPFQGQTPTDILSAILRDDPPPPSRANPAIPPDLDRIVAKCLEKDPEERYQDTRDLVVDLRKVKRATDSDVQVIRAATGEVTTPPRPASSPGRGKRLLWVAAGLIVAGLVAGGWLALRRGSHFPAGAATFKEGDRILVADFENATGAPVFDTAVRDSFEQMLSTSTYLDVLRGDRLKGLLAGRGVGTTGRMDPALAARICGEGACAGYVTGRIAGTDGRTQVEVTLHDAGGGRPPVPFSSQADSEEMVLKALAGLALDLRRAVGESPKAVSATWPVTTRSLAAYQAFAIGASLDRPDEIIQLYRRAVEIDPGFVEAYAMMGIEYTNLGDFRAYRRWSEEALRRSSGLPEQQRMWLEINVVDAYYDYDSEVDRLRTYARLYPLEISGFINLGWIYSSIHQDPAAAELVNQKAYSLGRNSTTLINLSNSLADQGKWEDGDRLVADYLGRGHSEAEAAFAIFQSHRARGDLKGILMAIDRIEKQAGAQEGGYPGWRFGTYLHLGRLREARSFAPAALRGAVNRRDLSGQLGIGLDQHRLESRLEGRQSPRVPEQVGLAEKSLLALPGVALFCAETGQAEPLAGLIAAHDAAEKGSTSRFVREELAFARGSLALIRGENAKARDLLEPLARSMDLQRRRHLLGRAYEGLGMWREAAAEYEAILRTPTFQALPALTWIPEQARLAGIYERLGDPARARHWYGRFLAAWGEGDPDIPEVIEARKRLGVLGVPASPSESPSTR